MQPPSTMTRVETSEPAGGTPGPSLGRPLPERYHATRLRQLARLELEEAQAEALWRDAARHRLDLQRQLGRDVGLRVALLDFIVNVRRQLVDPQIIERQALEAIEHQAVVDPVTGLYNRHYFEAELAREVERCRRYGSDLSLLLVDLDQFKQVNDQHGHATGDCVLRRVGALIRLYVRGADVPCRFGGDEFAVIVPDTRLADALPFAERMRAAVQEAFEREAVEGEWLRMTVSGGVAPMPPAPAGPAELFAAADRALYQAKAGGGNQIAAACART